MVSRSRVRLSRSAGLVLAGKCAWYLRRRNRRGKRRPRRHTARGAGQRLLDGQRRKVRAEYQLRDRQVGRLLDEATNQPGEAGERLIELLEQRVDVVVWRSGFARSMRQARNLIAHNHFAVDGATVDLPSYRLRPGQTVQVRDDRRDRRPFTAAGSLDRQAPPSYREVRAAQLSTTLTREPREQEVPVLREEPIVVKTATARAAR
jgi:small subunit ribosomal protein S4